MSYRLNNDWRGNRHYQIGSFPPAFGTMHYSIASYCTEKSSDVLSTESNKKSDLNETLTSETYLAQLQGLSNPLQKNLADTLPNIKAEISKNMTANYRHSRQKSFDFHVHETQTPPFDDYRAENTTFSGIGSFISNVFNVISQAMPFQRRQRTSSVKLDETDAPRDSSPPLVTWPKSNLDIQNKNKTQSQTHNHTIEINDEFNTKMNKECLSAASQCEGKLATVRHLLANKVAATKPVPVKPRRPRRVFVPPNSVEKVFEDAFNSEEYECMSNSHTLEHVTPSKNVVQHFVKLNCPKVNIQDALDVKDLNKAAQDNEEPIKSINCDYETLNEEINQEISSEITINEVAIPEILINNEVITLDAISTDNLPLAPSLECIIPNVEETDNFVSKSEDTNTLVLKSIEKDISQSQVTDNLKTHNEETNTKSEVVTSCEDKLNRLKAMLLERKLNSSTKHTKEPIKATEPKNQLERSKQHKKHSKKHKNPNRTTDKRQKCYQNATIKEDMSFATDLDTDLSRLDSSPQPHDKNQLHGQNTLETFIPKASIAAIKNDNEENCSKPQTIQESPIDCIFDEVSGRFRNSSTTESEDSFQIVFTDNTQPLRPRKLSDCDSEDSFIVFEDSPDSCYTSTDIFGDDETESSSSEYDSDSGNEVCKLNNAFSRTVSDLTDSSLYEPHGFLKAVHMDSEDEVDSAVKLGDVIQSDLIKDCALTDSAILVVKDSLSEDAAAVVKDTVTIVVDDSEDVVGTATPVLKDTAALEDIVDTKEQRVSLEDSDKPEGDNGGLVEDSGCVCDDEGLSKTGLLLTDEKKLQKRVAGPRKVRFSEAPPKVHVMRVWQFAARQARAGHWDRYALDRERFQRRIADVDMAISWVLKPQHRARVKFQRFMPWWHAQRRKEAAEKKLREEQEKIQKEEEEKLRKEEERLRIEEEERKKEEEEILKTEERTTIEDSFNFPAEVSVNGNLDNDTTSDIKPDNDIDKKDLMVITNKCLLNVDSINEIKMQISNEIKQLLASSDDELKSSTSDIAKRKTKDKSVVKKPATVLYKDWGNDNVVVANCRTNCQPNCQNSGTKKKDSNILNKNATVLNKVGTNDHKVNVVANCQTNCLSTGTKKKR